MLSKNFKIIYTINSIKGILLLQMVNQWEMSGYMVAVIHGKDESKCSCQDSGGQCVIMAGPAMMLERFVVNWDSQLLV